jgi:GNAT superfamily N-acetyltransferase
MVKDLGNFYLSDDNALILSRYEDVSAMLSRAYWVKARSADTMRRAMESSLNYAIFEKGSDRLAGYARVITDFATMYYLCDVFIHEDFRGKALGKALVAHITTADERLISLPGTLKTMDAQELYRKYGFTESPVACMSQSRGS